MKCLICGRSVSGELCPYHEAAKASLQEAYPLWAKAYGGMDWKDYLDSVKRNPQTGQWVKEIADFLRE